MTGQSRRSRGLPSSTNRHLHQLRPLAAPAHAARSRARARVAPAASVVWRQLDGSKAWLAHPRGARAKGVIHFLGGAFAGAAPQLLYNSFVEALADAGYTTVATPYQVTFRHDQAAKRVRQAFLDSVAELRAAGRAYLVPPRAPVFGVGHSNGALLHLLINSLEPGATQANVIISYNNLQVSDAIPIPGLLDGLLPTVQAARSISPAPSSAGSIDEAASGAASPQRTSSSSSSSSGRSSPSSPGSAGSSRPGSRASGRSTPSEALLAAAAASVPPFLLPQQQLLLGAAPALDQLASIVNEVGDGLTDFRPSPEESRALIAASYACPATLLVRFQDDSFDETPELHRLLSQRLAEAPAAMLGPLQPLQAAAGRSLPASAPGSGGASPRAPGAGVGAAAGPGAAAGAPGAAGSGGVSAWSSVDEDIDVANLLAQLQQLQAELARGLQGAPPGLAGSAGALARGLPALQQVLLPGSHVTPCGAVPGGAAGRPAGSAGALSPEQRGLADRVLAWLDAHRGLRPAAAAAGGGTAVCGTPRSSGPASRAASPGGRGSSGGGGEEVAADAVVAAAPAGTAAGSSALQ